MGKEKVLASLKDNISIEKMKQINKRENRIKRVLKSTFTFCIICLSISGIVFAKEISNKIYKDVFFAGEGISKAVEEGYIEQPKEDYVPSNTNIVTKNEETGKIIEDGETNVRISSIVMDDFNLSMTFDVDFSDNLKDVITEKEVFEMNFSDIVIYDENSNILGWINGVKLTEFFERHNMQYNYETYPEDKKIGSGMNVFVAEKDENHVRVVYNYYTGGDCIYPKSKKIFADFTEIRISKNECITGNEEISIKGNWNIEIDIPEKMYSRENTIYVQKDTTDKNYRITSAVVYNTGMQLEFEITGYKYPGMVEKSEEFEFYATLPEDSEFRSGDILSYISAKMRNTEKEKKRFAEYSKLYDFEIWAENKNGERFEVTTGPMENGGTLISTDNILTRSQHLSLTKYDETDEITVFVKHYGKEIKITLEKYKNN